MKHLVISKEGNLFIKPEILCLLQKEPDCKQEKILQYVLKVLWTTSCQYDKQHICQTKVLATPNESSKSNKLFNLSSTLELAIVLSPSFCHPFLHAIYLCLTELSKLSVCTSFIWSLSSFHWKTSLHSPVFLPSVCPSSCALLMVSYHSLS